MGEVLIRNAIKRETGYLYYIDKDGNICRSVQARGKNHKAIEGI
jgi:hypothetical protein